MKTGEIQCSICNGTGYQKDEYPVTMDSRSGKKYTLGYSRTCLKCFGKGDLDWIEAIVGKKIEDLKHDQLLEFARLR